MSPAVPPAVPVYVKAMGRFVRITAIADSDDAANAFMVEHPEHGVLAVTNGVVLLANVNDKGIAA